MKTKLPSNSRFAAITHPPTGRPLVALAAFAVLSIPLSAEIPPGRAWQIRRTVPEMATLHAVAGETSLGLLITVGRGGVIRHSLNEGVSWSLSASRTHCDLNSVAWTGERWVAVGGGTANVCEILTSSDGMIWDRICLGNADSLRSVAVGPDGVVAVGVRGQVARSQDLRNWSTSRCGGGPLNAVIWAGDRFVAAGDWGTVYTSSDGLSWTSHATGVGGSIMALAWNGSILAAGGYDSGHGLPLMLLSGDRGTSWSQRPMNGLPDSWIHSIVWTGSRFVATSSGLLILTSEHGDTWYAHPSPGLGSYYGLCWTGGHVVAVGYSGAFAVCESAAPALSSDWGSHVPPDLPDYPHALAEGDMGGTRRVVAVGDRGLLLSSDNGGESTTPQVRVTTDDLHGVTATGWSANRFIAAGENGTILTSPDGLAWTSRTAVTPVTLRSVEWHISAGTPLAIAVGDSGKVLTSGNGSAWTLRPSGTSRNLRGIASGLVENKPPTPATFSIVAVGDQGTILRSSTGSSWTTQTSGTVETLTAVARGGPRFVAVGVNGTVVTSPDGSTWTPRDSGIMESLMAITWTGSEFVTTGSNGCIFTSPTGATWTRRHGPTFENLTAVTTLSSGRLVAAGTFGVVMISDPQPEFTDWLAAQGVAPGEDGPDDDPNGDGVSNLLAYGFGIPPAAPATAEDLAALPVLVDPAPHGKITMRIAPHPAALADLVYVLEESETLLPGSWTEVARRLPGQDGALDPVHLLMSPGSRFAHLEFPEGWADRSRYFLRMRVELLVPP